jgi:hypothetical protein
VSLILEALKKLERDKQVPDRGGFLVMAARPWPSSEDSGRRLFVASLALAAFGIVGLTVAGVWWWEHRQAPVPVAAAAPVAPPAAVPASASRARSVALVPAAPPAVAPAKAAAVAKAPVERAPEAPAAKPAPVEAAAVEPAAVKKAAPELRLTAISEKDGKRVAILNERTVYEGDSFDGVTVVRIGESEVELDVNGRRRVIAF